MRRRGGMNDQALGIADVGEMGEELQVFDELLINQSNRKPIFDSMTNIFKNEFRKIGIQFF